MYVKKKIMTPNFQQIIDKLQIHLSRDYFDRDVKIEPTSIMHRRSSEIMKARLIFSNRTRNIFIKVYKLKNGSKDHLNMMQDRVKKDYEVTKFLNDSFTEYSGFSTAKPIVCFPELLAHVIEESPGQNFQKVLTTEARFYPKHQTLEKLCSLCYHCGQWLRIFQNVTQAEVKEKFNLDWMIEYVDLRLKKLVDNPKALFDQERRKHVLRYFDLQRKYINGSDLSMCGVHADFCPGNMLVNDTEVIGIDFAMYQCGSIYHDITHFYHQLELLLMKPIFRPIVISKLQNSFLKGYDENFDKNNPMFKLFRVQHITCHFVGILGIENPPLHERLFNKRIIKKHAKWLARVGKESV